MMRKILLMTFLLVLPISTFALNPSGPYRIESPSRLVVAIEDKAPPPESKLFKTYFPVKVWGDVSIFSSAFNVTAMFFNSKEYETIFSVATLIWLMMTVLGFIGFLKEKMNYLVTSTHSICGLMFLLVVAALTIPNSTKVLVEVEDMRSAFATKAVDSPSMARIENVPVFLALPASVASTFGATMLNLIDSLYTPIDGMRFTDIGFLKNYDMLRTEKFVRLDNTKEGAEFVSEFKQYLRDCVTVALVNVLGKDPKAFIGDGVISLEKIKPGNIDADTMDSLRDSHGETCSRAYENLENKYIKNSPLLKNYANHVAKSQGFSSFAAAQHTFNILHERFGAGVEMTKEMNKYVGLQMQASLSEAVSEARYADSLGLTGIQANTVNYNMNTAMLRAQTDGLKASQATYTLTVAPHVLNYVTALSYFLFPLIFIVAIVKGLFFGLKVLFNYITGLLAIEVYRWSLAIIHGITSSLTSQNAAEVLMGGKGAEMIHSTAYYAYMGSETDVALFMVKIVWVLPLVIWSGSVAMVMRTGSGAAEANGMQDTQGASQQILSANAAQTSKMMAENLSGKDMSMAEYLTTVQGGRELDMQVQALSAAMKASHSDDYFKGALGQSAQQIGSTMGYGSQMEGFKDINQVMKGGEYGGISQATSALAIGNVMENGSYSAGLSQSITGQALAKASGNFQAESQIGQAKGLVASGVYDTNGNVSKKVRADGLNDHDLLMQGLENQSRMSVNQTIGVGKEDLSGQAGIDKMNAIQYASHAGIKGQIAQGKALKETFGKDLEGSSNSLGMSYDKMALNNAENQLNQSVAQADAFGEVKNKYGGLENMAKARETNAQIAMNQEMDTGQTLQEKMRGGKYSKPTQSQADQDSIREGDKKILDALEKIYEGLKDDNPHKQAAFDNYQKKAQEYADKYLDKDGNNKQFDDRLSIDDITSTQAQMNVVSQIGSTKANQKYLNEVGFSAVASNMATNTDMQNIKSAQTAQSAREEFGDVIGGVGNGSYKDASYYNARKEQDSAIGSAKGIKRVYEGYDTFDKDGNKIHIDGNKNTFKEMAQSSILSQGTAHNLKMNQTANDMKDKVLNSEEYKQELTDKTRDSEYQQAINADNEAVDNFHYQERNKIFSELQNAQKIGGKTLKQAQNNFKSNLDNLNKVSEVFRQSGKARIDKEYESELNQIKEEIMQDHISREDILNQHAMTIASDQNLQYAQTSANVSQAQTSGFINSQGNTTQYGTQAFNVMSAKRYGEMQKEFNTYGNKTNQDNIISQLKASGANQSDINALEQARNLGGTAGFVRELSSKFGYTRLSLQTNGNAMNLTVGADGRKISGVVSAGLSKIYNDSETYKFGVNADGGNLAYKAVHMTTNGNINAMRAAAYTGAGIDMVQKTTSLITDLAPTGKIFKAGKAVKDIYKYSGEISSLMNSGSRIGKINLRAKKR